MIVTSKQNELAFHSQVIGGDLQVWRDAHLDVEYPYFMVIYSARETNVRVRQTCLIWQMENLISLCNQIESDPETELIRVCLLSPPWMNGSKIWRIDQINEIWKTTNLDSRIGLCYILEDSTRLFDSKIELNPENWEITDSVFLIHQYTRITDFDSEYCIEFFTNTSPMNEGENHSI